MTSEIRIINTPNHHAGKLDVSILGLQHELLHGVRNGTSRIIDLTEQKVLSSVLPSIVLVFIWHPVQSIY
jgi:hypothetical protein